MCDFVISKDLVQRLEFRGSWMWFAICS